MKHPAFAYTGVLLVGILFGVTMTQSQAISWYRIHEMFRFGSFHMYGIIGSALILGIGVTRIIRRFEVKNRLGHPIHLPAKDAGWKRYLLGGLIFGLGWGLAGACPGPMLVLLGHGLWPAGVILASAVMGTLAYGFSRHKLPH